MRTLVLKLGLATLIATAIGAIVGITTSASASTGALPRLIPDVCSMVMGSGDCSGVPGGP